MGRGTDARQRFMDGRVAGLHGYDDAENQIYGKVVLCFVPILNDMEYIMMYQQQTTWKLPKKVRIIVDIDNQPIHTGLKLWSPKDLTAHI
jgi:hypothetical protein